MWLGDIANFICAVGGEGNNCLLSYFLRCWKSSVWLLPKIAQTWFPESVKHQNTSAKIGISECSHEDNLWVTTSKYIRCNKFLKEDKSLVKLKYHSTPYSELLSNSSQSWLLWKADFLHSLLQEVSIFIHPKKINSLQVYINICFKLLQ